MHPLECGLNQGQGQDKLESELTDTLGTSEGHCQLHTPPLNLCFFSWS